MPLATSTPTKGKMSRSSSMSGIPVLAGKRGSVTKDPAPNSTFSAGIGSSGSSGALDSVDSKGDKGQSQSTQPLNISSLVDGGNKTTTNDKILAEVCGLYSGGGDKTTKGFIAIAKSLGIEGHITKPQHKTTVLLIGNHSAGKSSFINWYIQQPILKTSVAMETQGISVIVSGAKRETLRGAATLELFPHLKKLRGIPGVVNSLATEVCTSQAREFDTITFIDTPGLLDGNMSYAFDINETLVALGEMADLILVFFEPLGQALCKRTLDILEELWRKHGGESKIKLYLSKADEAGSDTDRQKVMMQIVQEICKRKGINRAGFDMPAIFIPSAYSIGADMFAFGRNANMSKVPKCTNQIEEVCREIRGAVSMNVQKALEGLDNDYHKLKNEAENKLKEQNEIVGRNLKKQRYKDNIFIASLIVPLLLAVVLFATFTRTEDSMFNGFWKGMEAWWISRLSLTIFVYPWAGLMNWIPTSASVTASILVIVGFRLWLTWANRIQLEKRMTFEELKELEFSLDFLHYARIKQAQLYELYLKTILRRPISGEAHGDVVDGKE